MWSSPPTMNISKTHLHVEQFSLKINWRLAERLFYNQGCKKNMHKESTRKGGEVIRLGPAPVGGDTEEERGIMGSEIPPGE